MIADRKLYVRRRFTIMDRYKDSPAIGKFHSCSIFITINVFVFERAGLRRLRFRAGLLILIALLAVLVDADGIHSMLRYQRTAVLEGEWWRLVSAHVVHLNAGHALWNGIGLLIIGVWWDRQVQGRGWWLVFAVSALGTGFGLLLCSPAIAWYVGLSGVLHGLFCNLALRLAGAGDVVARGVLVLIIFKLLLEQITGPLPGTALASGGPVVVDAHLYGALAGIIAALAQTRLPPASRAQ